MLPACDSCIHKNRILTISFSFVVLLSHSQDEHLEDKVRFSGRQGNHHSVQLREKHHQSSAGRDMKLINEGTVEGDA